jgi:hypothetical protein
MNARIMENLLALGLTTLASAFIGSYLASYLKKKGENLATHEDIDKLVDQVRAVAPKLYSLNYGYLKFSRLVIPNSKNERDYLLRNGWQKFLDMTKHEAVRHWYAELQCVTRWAKRVISFDQVRH